MSVGTTDAGNDIIVSTEGRLLLVLEGKLQLSADVLPEDVSIKDVMAAENLSGMPISTNGF